MRRLEYIVAHVIGVLAIDDGLGESGRISGRSARIQALQVFHGLATVYHCGRVTIGALTRAILGVTNAQHAGHYARHCLIRRCGSTVAGRCLRLRWQGVRVIDSIT